MDFTEAEHLICNTARQIEEDRTYWIMMIGPPQIAVHLALCLHAPNLNYFTEDGTVAPRPLLPSWLGVPGVPNFASRASYRAAMWTNMNTIGYFGQAGHIDYGILECLQIDPYGNVNHSLIGGTFDAPGRRYGGAGGANEIASCCWRLIIMARQEKRKFVPEVDFITIPGYLDGTPGARERAGLPANTGPYRVVTPSAMFGYDEETKRMKIIALSPWVTVDDVLSEMCFEPLVADELGVMQPPSENELRLLREVVDPPPSTVHKEGKLITM